jgi:hypothetical protein
MLRRLTESRPAPANPPSPGAARSFGQQPGIGLFARAGVRPRPGLLRDGRLSDLHRNGEVYHISSKGSDTARQFREQIDRGERPDYSHIERTMPDLLGEMREDFGKHPVIREMILLDSEDDCYNGRGVFS